MTSEVTEVRAVSGPMLLRVPAETFVKGWQADVYMGPRSCPVVVEYALASNAYVRPRALHNPMLRKFA